MKSIERDSDISNMEDTEKPRRIFVDLGSGTFPAAFSGNREFKGNDYYVGIENRRSEIERALSLKAIAKNKENFDRVGENILFIEATANSLPFSDNSVDEVLLGNVLGQKAIHVVDPFLKEGHRILKEDGNLIILETVTPTVAEDREEDGILSLMEKFGFELVREFRNNSAEFTEEVSKYAQHFIPYLNDTAFIMYFRKRKK